MCKIESYSVSALAECHIPLGLIRKKIQEVGVMAVLTIPVRATQLPTTLAKEVRKIAKQENREVTIRTSPFMLIVTVC